VQSSFLWALAIFVLINVFLNKENQSKAIAAATATARLSDYDGVERDPNYLEHAPNVVLIGSSLLIQPEWYVDRRLPLKEPWGKSTIISLSNYHLAQGLDNELARQGFVNPHVYSLAVGGALISDAYLLLYHYLKSYPKPKVVVLDCAPRSFNDTGVTQPDCTPIFDYCFRQQDFPELHKLYLRKFDAKANYIFSRIFFTYHYRQWLSELVKKHFSFALSDISQRFYSKPSTSSIQEETSLDAKKTPLSKDAGAVKLAKSLEEYKGRYWCMSPELLGPQLRFLNRFCELCAVNQIKLIVVNMPLSRKNRALLPKGFYAVFTRAAESSVRSPAVFKNLPELMEWPADCYDDSVHLNEKGGTVLNHWLAQFITKAIAQ
jgi:hypothetical protein